MEKTFQSEFHPYSDEELAQMYTTFKSMGLPDSTLPSFKEAKEAYFRFHGTYEVEKVESSLEGFIKSMGF